jgi:hypothetical protein
MRAVAIATLVVSMFGVAAVAAGGPETTREPPATVLKVAIRGGAISLDAVNAPLDRVLVEIGRALHAKIIVETILAGDIASTRVTRSFSDLAPEPAFRRLLPGRNYALIEGPKGVDELRVFASGTMGFRDLTAAAAPGANGQPVTLPAVPWPADDPAEAARLREAALGAADSSTRREALEELATTHDSVMLRDTLTRVLARERDAKVLTTLLEVAAQQADGLPSEALRRFVASDRDGTVRALAVDQLVAQAGNDPATRSMLRTLAADDASAEVREAAEAALQNLDIPPAPLPPAAKTGAAEGGSRRTK